MAWGENDFVVTSTTEQSFIPGVEDAKPWSVVNMNLELQTTDSLTLDSLQYKGKIHSIKTMTIPCSVNLRNGVALGLNADTTVAENHILLYYHKGTVPYKYLIESITQLETMYMP
jgi:hypothetical protein